MLNSTYKKIKQDFELEKAKQKVMKIKSQNERLGPKTSFVRVLYLTEITKFDYV